nr:MAG TPA: Phosphoinositide-interacting protein family [Caudoviricetes sp.]
MTITIDLVKLFVWFYLICTVITGVTYTFKILKAESKVEAISYAIGVAIIAIATYLLVKAYL